jgi:hypothetical protein
MKLSVVHLAAAALLGSYVPAGATLISQLSTDGGATFSTICSAASGTSCGSLAFTTTNNLAFTIFGVSSNSPGNAVDADLLQATVKLQNVGATTSAVILRVSDTGYTSPSARGLINIAGTVTIGGLVNLFSQRLRERHQYQNACGRRGTATPIMQRQHYAPARVQQRHAQRRLMAPFLTWICHHSRPAGSTVNALDADPCRAELMGLALMGVTAPGLTMVHRRSDGREPGVGGPNGGPACR